MKKEAKCECVNNDGYQVVVHIYTKIIYNRETNTVRKKKKIEFIGILKLYICNAVREAFKSRLVL